MRHNWTPRLLAAFWIGLTIAGGILIAVGAVLPWSIVSAGPASIVRSGMATGAGPWTAVLGILLAILALPFHVLRRLRTGGSLMLVGGSIAAFLAAGIELVVLLIPAAGGSAQRIDIGAGTWASLIGAALAAAGGLHLLVRGRSRPDVGTALPGRSGMERRGPRGSTGQTAIREPNTKVAFHG